MCSTSFNATKPFAKESNSTTVSGHWKTTCGVFRCSLLSARNLSTTCASGSSCGDTHRGKCYVRKGEHSDSFFLVRLGFVKVSQSHPGGDLVLGYIGRSGFLGEISLLGAGAYTATCTALDHVEAVRIAAEDFRLMIEQFPDVKQDLQAVAQQRIAENRARLTTIRSAPIDSFLAQGLMDAQSLLVLDLERCTRCDQCVRACADAHDGVSRLIRDGLRLDKYLIATSCRQCKDPLVHGRMSSGVYPAQEQPGDGHRGLVHWMWTLCQQLSLRKYQHASVPGPALKICLSLAARSRRCKTKPPPATSASTMTSRAASMPVRTMRRTASILSEFFAILLCRATPH